jgi:N-acetylneuraminic acid mutarotase
VLLQQLSTVGAAKLRPFRDATANMWAEGKPSVNHAMVASPDGSLYVFGGESLDDGGNDLFKLDLDTKEWNIIQPQGLLRPSTRSDHAMVAVGSDLYVFGGRYQTVAGDEDAAMLAIVWAQTR